MARDQVLNQDGRAASSRDHAHGSHDCLAGEHRDGDAEPVSVRLMQNGVAPSGRASLFVRRGRTGAQQQEAALVVEGFGDDPSAVLCGVMSARGGDARRAAAKLRDSLCSLVLDEHRAAMDPIACLQAGRLPRSNDLLKLTLTRAHSVQATSNLQRSESHSRIELRSPSPQSVHSRLDGIQSLSSVRLTPTGSFPELSSLAGTPMDPSTPSHLDAPSFAPSRFASSRKLPVLGESEWTNAFSRTSRALRRQGSSSEEVGVPAGAACLALLQGQRLTLAASGWCRAVIVVKAHDGRFHGKTVLEEWNKQSGNCLTESSTKAKYRKDPAIGPSWLFASEAGNNASGHSANCCDAALGRAGGTVSLTQPVVVQMDVEEDAQFLILATNSVWSVLSVEAAVSTVVHALSQQCKSISALFPLPAQLLEHFQLNAAKGLVDAAKRRAAGGGRQSMAAAVLTLKSGDIPGMWVE